MVAVYSNPNPWEELPCLLTSVLMATWPFMDPQDTVEQLEGGAGLVRSSNMGDTLMEATA